MKRFALLTVLLAACGLPAEQKPEMAKPVDEADPLDETVMTPMYEQLIQHTQIAREGRATHPSASRDGRFFVYASTETSAKPQIFVRLTDGVAPTQLTNNHGNNLYPRLSPDGKRVAFASDVSGNWDIYVIHTGAPSMWTQITQSRNDDIAPSWSPDGKKLVYCSKQLSGAWQLIIVDIATGIPTYLGWGLYPDWSPDGDWIAYQNQPRAKYKTSIWLIRPDGTDVREIVADRNKHWAAIVPRWSPDGQWIAYGSVRRNRAEESDDIYVIQPDGKYDTRVTDDLSAEGWPSWGGNRIFFISDRDGHSNIYSARPKPLVSD
jgi:TolB protein